MNTIKNVSLSSMGLQVVVQMGKPFPKGSFEPGCKSWPEWERTAGSVLNDLAESSVVLLTLPNVLQLVRVDVNELQAQFSYKVPVAMEVAGGKSEKAQGIVRRDREGSAKDVPALQ